MEHLAGYVQRDLIVASSDDWADLAEANGAARVWCDEVNTTVHAEIAAVPAERLLHELVRPGLSGGS